MGQEMTKENNDQNEYAESEENLRKSIVYNEEQKQSIVKEVLVLKEQF